MAPREDRSPPVTGLRTWLTGARPATLPAAVVPVLVGTAVAADGAQGTGQGVVAWRFGAALVVALAVQVGTNFANDRSDGVRGTDDDRSGPIRLVASGAASPRAVAIAAAVSFAVAAVAGSALAVAVSPWLILVGAVCIAAGWLYTGGPRPYGYAGLGEVFVFVFFGLVATVGSAFVQTGSIEPLAIVSAIPVGLFATAMLVVNNLRDIPTDSLAGKRTLAVRMGDRRSRFLYLALMAVPFVFVPVVAGAGQRPLAVVALLAVILARYPVQRVLEGAAGPALNPVLASTGRVQLVFGVLLSGGLWFSA